MTIFKNNRHRARLTALAVACALTWGAAPAQQQQQAQGQQQTTITPAFRDADITQIIEAVSQVTGKTFIVDPRVRAQVTMLSSTPMSPDAFYETFLVDPAGARLRRRAVRQRRSRSFPTRTRASCRATTCRTRVNRAPTNSSRRSSPCSNVNAAQLVPVLRPLMPQAAHLAAYPAATS